MSEVTQRAPPVLPQCFCCRISSDLNALSRRAHLTVRAMGRDCRHIRNAPLYHCAQTPKDLKPSPMTYESLIGVNDRKPARCIYIYFHISGPSLERACDTIAYQRIFDYHTTAARFSDNTRPKGRSPSRYVPPSIPLNPSTSPQIPLPVNNRALHTTKTMACSP